MKADNFLACCSFHQHGRLAITKVANATAKIATTTFKVAGNAAAKFLLKSTLEELKQQVDFDKDAEDVFAAEIEGQVAKFILERNSY